MPPISEVLQWRGQTMVGSDAEKIGKIDEIYLDAETEQPEWALVHTGMFGSLATFVPIADASAQDDKVHVHFDKAQVKDAPQPQADGELSQADAAALYAHYGLDDGADTDPIEGHDETHDGRQPSDDAMTRSEQELRVGTIKRETGKARLVKHIVTENVTKTVPVQREEVRVEREPITDANRDAATTGDQLTEAQHEVTLHEDEITVDKQTVPKERVRMHTDVNTEQREITEQIAKEHIDTEDTPAH